MNCRIGNSYLYLFLVTTLSFLQPSQLDNDIHQIQDEQDQQQQQQQQNSVSDQLQQLVDLAAEQQRSSQTNGARDRLDLLQSMLAKLRYRMSSNNHNVNTNKRTAKTLSSKRTKRSEVRYGVEKFIDGKSVITCPKEPTKLFACPSHDKLGRYICIDDHAICDQKKHCPQGEDEDKTVCMFHEMTMNFFKTILDVLFDLTNKRD